MMRKAIIMIKLSRLSHSVGTTTNATILKCPFPELTRISMSVQTLIEYPWCRWNSTMYHAHTVETRPFSSPSLGPGNKASTNAKSHDPSEPIRSEVRKLLLYCSPQVTLACKKIRIFGKSMYLFAWWGA